MIDEVIARIVAEGSHYEESAGPMSRIDFQNDGKNYLATAMRDEREFSVAEVDPLTHAARMCYWNGTVAGGKGTYEGTEFPLDLAAIGLRAAALDPDPEADAFLAAAMHKIAQRTWLDLAPQVEEFLRTYGMKEVFPGPLDAHIRGAGLITRAGYEKSPCRRISSAKGIGPDQYCLNVYLYAVPRQELPKTYNGLHVLYEVRNGDEGVLRKLVRCLSMSNRK